MMLLKGEIMDNFLINMTLATCAGWIMDNLPIIMTLGTPDPYLGCTRASESDGEGIFVALDRQYCTIKAHTHSYVWLSLPTKMYYYVLLMGKTDNILGREDEINVLPCHTYCC